MGGGGVSLEVQSSPGSEVKPWKDNHCESPLSTSLWFLSRGLYSGLAGRGRFWGCLWGATREPLLGADLACSSARERPGGWQPLQGPSLPFWSPLSSHSCLSLLSLALREFSWVLTRSPTRSVHQQKASEHQNAGSLASPPRGGSESAGPRRPLPRPQEAPRGGRWAH